MFETDILPTVEIYARQRFRGDDEMVALALVLAWWYWRGRPQDYAAGHWARLAVRAVYCGRDLPRIGRTRPQDALSHSLSGCGMEQAADPKPGPAQVIEDREQVELLFANLNDRETQIAEMLTSGAPAGNVARAFNISPGRITQIRQALMDRLLDLE